MSDIEVDDVPIVAPPTYESMGVNQALQGILKTALINDAAQDLVRDKLYCVYWERIVMNICTKI